MRIGGVSRADGYGWIPVRKVDRIESSSGGRWQGSRQAGGAAPQIASSGAYDGARSVSGPLPWLRGIDLSSSILAEESPAQTEATRYALKRRLDAYTKYMGEHEDLDHVIELMLTEARDGTRSDGGTFYLASTGRSLRFAFFQNDTISSAADDRYVGHELPIDESSICGYAALTRRVLNIPDAYAIPEDAPYRFNSSYDESSGYRTVSMLTVPVEDGNALLGVLQLVNRLTKDGEPRAYGPADEEHAQQLAKRSAPYMRDAMLRDRISFSGAPFIL